MERPERSFHTSHLRILAKKRKEKSVPTLLLFCDVTHRFDLSPYPSFITFSFTFILHSCSLDRLLARIYHFASAVHSNTDVYLIINAWVVTILCCSRLLISSDAWSSQAVSGCCFHSYWTLLRWDFSSFQSHEGDIFTVHYMNSWSLTVLW